MNKSRHEGDHHVLEVYHALRVRALYGDWSQDQETSTLLTAQYIWDKLGNIDSIQHKFQFDNPDKHNDLIITANKRVLRINLFKIKGKGNIQPKNIGAKSFIEKYFLDPNLQKEFNQYIAIRHKKYLIELLDAKGLSYPLSTHIDLKKQVSLHCPHFDDEANYSRERFLFALREQCFTLLLQGYNTNKPGFMNAFHELMLCHEMNIITRFHPYGVEVDEFHAALPEYEDIKLYKKGKNSIGFQMGQISLLLRFKFENKPDSSIKLATSYEFFHTAAEFKSKVEQQNLKTIKCIDSIDTLIKTEEKQNISNAVGKCHEAYTYYWLLHKYPKAIQSDDSECISYLMENVSYIPENTLKNIKESSSVTADTISKYLFDKYKVSEIESIQLVADIYVSDKLNTGDVKINIRHSDRTVEEIFISLKALRTSGQKITTKNPGIGTILGPTYFNVKDLTEVINEERSDYERHQDHQTSLIKFSNVIGISLESAPQENLKRGIENLLGKALMVITFYEQKEAYYKEHKRINSPVTVLRNTPTNIQNTLAWNDGAESISLRVKFSRSQKYGWSTVKLTSEYSFNPRKAK